jgi:transcriptional regulator with XRE-family HTH domain
MNKTKRSKNPVKIQDVAAEAGVSVSTVSRVLNDKDDVSLETFNRVTEVINNLGYTSSLAARSMRSQKTNVIGLIMPDAGEPFPIEVMRVNYAIAALITTCSYIPAVITVNITLLIVKNTSRYSITASQMVLL